MKIGEEFHVGQRVWYALNAGYVVHLYSERYICNIDSSGFLLMDGLGRTRGHVWPYEVSSQPDQIVDRPEKGA